MALNYVTLNGTLLNVPVDANVVATFTASNWLTDQSDHYLIPPAPVQVRLNIAGFFTVSLLATDNANLPAGWYWTVAITGIPTVATESFSFFLAFANGSVQDISGLATLPSPVPISPYMPVPAGTPQAGWIALATGNGQGSVWATPPGGPPTGGAGGALNGSYPNPGLATTLDQVPAPTANVSLNSKRITALANGLANSDAAAVGQIPTSAASIGGLLAASNLSDLASASTARTNLGLGSAALLTSSAVAQTANNLSDLASAATARTNLGLGSAAVLASSAVAQTANNLSDLASAATARTNLGLGSAATQNSSAFLQPANNLSDISSAATARTNLGLGSAATQSSSAFDAAGAATTAQTNAQNAHGLQYMTGGGTITATTISNAISAGYIGIYLDPRNQWDMSGLVINGVSSFIIASDMSWNIAWNGNITYNTSGYVKTSTASPADGVQIYSSAPTGGSPSPTNGVVLRGLVLVGSNSNAVLHLGGGQRNCKFVDCLFYNTSSATGAYAVINDTALSDNNGEQQHFTRCGMAGAYAAYGIGTADQTQRANDTFYDGLVTSGGTYSIVASHGGGHNFMNYYDRSSPSTAVVYNHGAFLYFRGGEDLNNLAASGVAHLLDNANAVTMINGRNLTQGANATAATVSNGKLIFRDFCKFNGPPTFNVTGSGVVDLSDAAINPNSAVITGSGTVRANSAYISGTTLAFSSWTGTTTYNGAVQAQTPAAGFAMVLNSTPTIVSYTTPNDGNPHTVMIGGDVHVTSAETGGILNITTNDPGGNTITSQVDNGGHGLGTFAITGRVFQVGPGVTVSLVQATGFTAGAATVFASIFGT